MSVLTDSRYGALASSAARGLGASSPDITRAILSQWQCELGAQAPYPPLRNNPGNIARGLATDLGLSFTVQTPNPQPSNPIVTFSSPEGGAQAYAAAIRSMSRYRHALTAAIAGDGQAYIRAIGTSGWGTGTGCMLSVYRSSGGGGSNPTGGGSSGSGATVLSIPNARTVSACTQVTILSPNPVQQNITRYMPIPPTSINDPCVRCADGWKLAVVQPDNYFPGQWVLPSQLQPGQPNACVRNDVGVGPVNPVPGAPGGPDPVAALGGVFQLDLSQVGPLALNGGVLVITAYLVLSGLGDLLKGP